MFILESYTGNNIDFMLDEITNLNYLSEADDNNNSSSGSGQEEKKDQDANNDQKDQQKNNSNNQNDKRNFWKTFMEKIQNIFNKLIERFKTIYNNRIANKQIKNIPENAVITDYDYKDEILGNIDTLINTTTQLKSKLPSIINSIKSGDLESASQSLGEYKEFCNKILEIKFEDNIKNNEKVEITPAKKKNFYLNLQSKLEKIKGMDSNMESLSKSIQNTMSFVNNNSNNDDSKDKKLKYLQTIFTMTARCSATTYKFVANTSGSLQAARTAKEKTNNENNNNNNQGNNNENKK